VEAKPTQVVAQLRCRVVGAEESGHQPAKALVGEASDSVDDEAERAGQGRGASISSRCHDGGEGALVIALRLEPVDTWQFRLGNPSPAGSASQLVRESAMPPSLLDGRRRAPRSPGTLARLERARVLAVWSRRPPGRRTRRVRRDQVRRSAPHRGRHAARTSARHGSPTRREPRVPSRTRSRSPVRPRPGGAPPRPPRRRGTRGRPAGRRRPPRRLRPPRRRARC